MNAVRDFSIIVTMALPSFVFIRPRSFGNNLINIHWNKKHNYLNSERYIGTSPMHVQPMYPLRAFPSDAVSAAVVTSIVGVSAAALLLLNRDKMTDASIEEVKCDACDGTGICSGCNGEGFQLKGLSEEAVARARANAQNAATRYTAGLAKKWNYCVSCSGSRKCMACDGRGRCLVSGNNS